MLEASMWYNWGEVVDALLAEKLFSEIFVLAYFVLFGVLTTFVLFNVFYAVICEVVLDYSNTKVPSNASTSFWNRVILQLLFQLFEIVLTDEDQKRIENENLTSYERIKLFYEAMRAYWRDIVSKFRSSVNLAEIPEYKFKEDILFNV